MTTIQTAVGECLRTGIDALRGLGYSFSVADRLSRMLTWSEATGLGGFSYVRVNENRIKSAMSKRLTYASRVVGGVKVNVLHSDGKSLFEVGPRALDLAHADTRLQGAGLSVAQETFGTLLLGELTQTAVERGFGTLIGFCGNADAGNQELNSVLLRVRDSLAEVEVVENDAGQKLSVFAPVFEKFIGQDALEALFSLLAEKSADEGLSNVVILSFPIEESDSIVALFHECCGRANLPIHNRQLLAWYHAVHNGFRVEEADWTYLHSLVARIRVQTSERSRSHAG